MSKLDEVELLEVFYHLLKRIHFVNEDSIPLAVRQEAYILTEDIDEKDTVFIAMGKHIGCPIWSGDKALAEGLRRKGFQDILLTQDLLALLGK